MTKDIRQTFADLERLADLLAEEALNATDEEILAELEASGELDAVVKGMDNALERATLLRNKNRLRIARAAVEHEKAARTAVTPTAQLEPRQRLADALKEHPTLTLAARHGRGLSENDEASLVEDIEELKRLQEPDEE